MTTELEQEFFSMFGIKQEYQYHVRDMGRSYVGNKQMLIDNKHLFMDKERKKSRRLYVANVSKIYPDITAEKLLEMVCIWNYIMPCIDDCIIPIDYLGLKSVVLDKIIRYSEIEYEFDVDALKYQIQQLFKEA